MGKIKIIKMITTRNQDVESLLKELREKFPKNKEKSEIG